MRSAMPIRRHCGFLLAKSLQRALLVSTLSTKQRPNARAYARVRRFSFFAFTASPLDDKALINRDLRVKASPHSPSPVKC